ncbi:MAG: ribosomal protein L7/L12 [Myxococcales bacterium]|nr:ribosomal protein L7/L12 [Myxococcales bacterium]
MSQTSGLKCYHCNAPLVPPPPGQNTVQCSYCGEVSMLGAAPPVAAPSIVGGGMGWAVRLDDVGRMKISVIKAVREATGLGLKESKELTDDTPVVVRANLGHDQAQALAEHLRAAGAQVSVIPQ